MKANEKSWEVQPTIDAVLFSDSKTNGLRIWILLLQRSTSWIWNHFTEDEDKRAAKFDIIMTLMFFVN